MDPVYLSTAYLAPIEYYAKLYQFRHARIERMENYLKQSYRNRCIIAAANGPMPLTVPVEKSETLKCLTKDIRISDHGNWRHLHWNALISAYNMSPFFPYYADDFAPFYKKHFEFLYDFNEELRRLICSLIDLDVEVTGTTDYLFDVRNDFREGIRPRHPAPDPAFKVIPYYQVFKEKRAFIPNLSIVDLLFNMGPESLLVLRDSIVY